MASTLIQFRADDADKIAASQICDDLGINLQVYLKLCMTRLIKERGIPFSMKLDTSSDDVALKALKRASQIAEENGIADMTLDEINAEISEVRNRK